MLLQVTKQNQIMIYIQTIFSKLMQTLLFIQAWGRFPLSEDWLLRSHMWDTALNIPLVWDAHFMIKGIHG